MTADNALLDNHFGVQTATLRFLYSSLSAFSIFSCDCQPTFVLPKVATTLTCLTPHFDINSSDCSLLSDHLPSSSISCLRERERYCTASSFYQPCILIADSSPSEGVVSLVMPALSTLIISFPGNCQWLSVDKHNSAFDPTTGTVFSWNRYVSLPLLHSASSFLNFKVLYSPLFLVEQQLSASIDIVLNKSIKIVSAATLYTLIVPRTDVPTIRCSSAFQKPCFVANQLVGQWVFRELVTRFSYPLSENICSRHHSLSAAQFELLQLREGQNGAFTILLLY